MKAPLRIKYVIKSYPVEQFAGLIFAYMGEGPAPLIPKYDLFLEENAIRTIGTAVIPCNWLQIMENSLDPVHLEWLHGQHMQHVLRREGQLQDMPYAKLNSGKHKKIKFDG